MSCDFRRVKPWLPKFSNLPTSPTCNLNIMPSPLQPSSSPSESISWGWALLGGVLGLMLAVVLLAPSFWLATALGRATTGQVQLVDTTGTVWTGSGQLLMTGGLQSRESAALPGRLNWKLRLDGFALRLELDAGCCTSKPLQVRVQPRWGGVSVQIGDGTSEWPAYLLAGLGAPWNTLQANGNLRLLTQGLAFEWTRQQPVLSGRAELTADTMTSSLTTLKPMGSYQLSLVGSNEFRLVTLEGGLQLSGSGRWVGPKLRFEGIANAAPGYEAELANLLNIIGQRSGSRSIITLG